MKSTTSLSYCNNLTSTLGTCSTSGILEWHQERDCLPSLDNDTVEQQEAAISHSPHSRYRKKKKFGSNCLICLPPFLDLSHPDQWST